MIEPFSAALDDVTLRYRRGTVALDHASFTVRPGTITGLLGRNGAGKSTALGLLASCGRPTSGRVLVDGADPFEDAVRMSGVQIVRDSGDVAGDVCLVDTMRLYARMRPTWDARLAETLLQAFDLDPSRTAASLSRGQRSAFGCLIGLASRAPLTIFDETYLGMDAPTRYAFYDALVDDYTEHPRTIVLSTHLIEEVERLFEDVIVLDRGRTLAAESADDLRGRATSLVGPSTIVSKLSADRTVLATRNLGGTTQVTMVGGLDHADRRRAEEEGVEIARVSLQDLFIHLTNPATALEELR